MKTNGLAGRQGPNLCNRCIKEWSAGHVLYNKERFHALLSEVDMQIPYYEVSDRSFSTPKLLQSPFFDGQRPPPLNGLHLSAEFAIYFASAFYHPGVLSTKLESMEYPWRFLLPCQ